MKEKLKNDKGITLMVLVITIVILIILSGISISILLGENGIISRAKNAQELSKQAQENELISLNEIESQIDTIVVEGSAYVPKDSYEELKKYYQSQIDKINEENNKKVSEKDAELTTLKETGDASEENILQGKTALVKGNLITGTMKDNKILNWNPSEKTTYQIPSGYYSGGTLDSTNSYNAGHDTGYNAGYNAGHSSGYNEGYNAGHDTGYNEGTSANTLKTQSITQTLSYGNTRKIATFTFTNLTSVVGITAITSNRSDDYLSGYSSMAGQLFIISGNTVTICVLDGGGINSNGNWTVTAIGY